MDAIDVGEKLPVLLAIAHQARENHRVIAQRSWINVNLITSDDSAILKAP
jgi:hypothetical protein